jgi:hypothetical protein
VKGELEKSEMRALVPNTRFDAERAFSHLSEIRLPGNNDCACPKSETSGAHIHWPAPNPEPTRVGTATHMLVEA